MESNPDRKRLGGDLANNEVQNRLPSDFGSRFYEIRVKGHLSSEWSDWLEDLEVKLLDNGEMILSGPIVDQSALIGVLNKLCHLNLALISVNEIK